MPLNLFSSKQIKAARALLGWNQDDLAQASKISKTTITRIEKHENIAAFSVQTIEKIINAFKANGLEIYGSPETKMGVYLNLEPRDKPISKP